MSKPTFTDEFKQGVVNYVLEHPDESKVAIAKQFGVADSTVHKWLKETDPKASVTSMLEKLNISKSGYYDYLKRKPCNQKIRRAKLAIRIKEIHKESKEIYGAPKITRILQSEGHKVSERFIGKIMKENNIKAHYIKPYTVTTVDCDFSNKLHNILKRDFNPKSPNEAWCTDITYIWTHDEGFVYLNSVMDLYSRKIIALALSRTLDVDEVLKCLETVKRIRKTVNPVVIQSDRGVHYTSKKYQELTKDMVCSYSRKGNPWDNACIESYHSLIKREWLNRFKIMNYYHAYKLVFEYLEGFYNTVRIHSHCDYLSPDNFERKYILEQTN